MKRSPPPKRRKPLKRVALRLTSKPIPKVSKRRLAQLGAEVDFRNVCAARVGCEAFGLVDQNGVPVCGHDQPHLGAHAHHVRPRSNPFPGLHDPEKNGLWLCNAVHHWIHHVDPKEARRLGLLR